MAGIGVEDLPSGSAPSADDHWCPPTFSVRQLATGQRLPIRRSASTTRRRGHAPSRPAYRPGSLTLLRAHCKTRVTARSRTGSLLDSLKITSLRYRTGRGTLCVRTTAEGRTGMTQTPPGGGPTVLRMILGRQLQALREKAGMSYDQAAEAIYSSSYTIRRMERAEGGLKPLTVKSLLHGLRRHRRPRDRRVPGPGPRREQARLVAQLQRRPPGLVPHLRRPGRSRQPHPRLRPAGSPGLLQTPDYARASAAPASRAPATTNGAWRCGWPASTLSTRPDPPGCGWSWTRTSCAARSAPPR